MKVKLLICVLFAAPLAFAQESGDEWAVGGNIGYGFYHNGTIYGPGSSATAGIRNRFAAGFVLSEDLKWISGEFRYLYQDGHPYVSGAGTRTDIQGQSHALVYNLLVHFEPAERRLRFFAEGGAGGKGYIIAGPPPVVQPLSNLVTLTSENEWKFVVDVGGGVKYLVRDHLLVRFDFLDYLTTFPKDQIRPAPNNTARGVFQQFTPLFGVSYGF